MKNFISPCNHPESPLTASTIENMMDYTKELGLNYFSITDQGYLASILKGYMYGQKEDIKIIPGVEIYFKDNDCEIIKNTPSQNIKYFKLFIHCRDQKAYQKLVLMCSDFSNFIVLKNNKYPLFTWKKLEEISKENVLICTSDVQCMVSKHLLVGRPDLALMYYRKLRNIFGDRLYFSITPYKFEQYWNPMVEVKLLDKTIYLYPQDRIETDQYDMSKAIELTKFYSKHKELKYIYIDKIRHKVDDKYKLIKSAKLINIFQNILPQGDIQTNANNFILALTERFGAMDRVLLNHCSFYAKKEDKIVQDMKLGEENRVHQEQHIRSTEEIVGYLQNELKLDLIKIEKIVENSYTWADNFKDFKLKYEYKLPDCGPDVEKQMLDIIKVNGRMKWDNPRYLKQFREEYELLANNGKINLIPYFLPLVDIFKFYKDSGYLTGPSRGSAGGFLLSYLMGVTNIDPIKYGLSSARFLTLDRIQQGNLPDIDSDFESRIPLVGEDGSSGYLYEKYDNKAAQMSTRTLLRIKSAILDANRFVKGEVEEEIAKLSKSLPNTPQGLTDNDYVFGYEDVEGNHIPGLIETNEDLQRYAVNRPQEWDIVKKSLSLSRQASRHACGYCLSSEPIENTIPIFGVGEVDRVTQFEAKQCEFAGMIKYDFLVVSCLRDINLCLKGINSKNNKSYETGYFTYNNKNTYIWDLPEDHNVFKMLGDGKTETIFQLNTISVTPFVQAIKPKNIIDCATITSLVRPGPLDFKDPKTNRNMAEEYIYRRHGESECDIPILKELLPETYGILVFQEQISRVAKELGQMCVIDAENVRIAMGKKKRKLIDSLKPKFIEGAIKKIDKEIAEKIWGMMETFARYGFNLSHAVGYSVISYACAFLKYHYPLEWWAAVLSNADDKEINEVFYPYIKDMVLPPDINLSNEQMVIDYSQGKIRNKLSIITGLGNKNTQKIMDGRPYKDIYDFVNKEVCGDSLAKKLIYVGVLDSLFPPNTNFINKLAIYQKAIVQKNFDEKIQEYDIKINNLKTTNPNDPKIQNTIKNKDKFIAKGPKPVVVDEEFASYSVSPYKDFLIKKSIFPTMNLDLYSILTKDPRIITTGKYSIITGIGKQDYRFVNGEFLQKIDNTNVSSNINFCTGGYVVDAKEFTYAKGAKKALKLIIDSDGYSSEKVLWPDYNTSELVYPEDLKKGCIAYFVFQKREGKPNTNIVSITVIEKSIL